MQNMNNQGPVTNSPMQGAPSPAHSKNLLVIAFIIVVLLAVAGVAYWMLPPSPAKAPETKNQIIVSPTPVAALDDDTTQSIENDLNATASLGDLDKEFSDIDKEIQGL